MIHLDICAFNKTFKISVEKMSGEIRLAYTGKYYDNFQQLLAVATSAQLHDDLDVEDFESLPSSNHAEGFIDMCYVEPQFHPHVPLSLPTKRKLMMSQSSVLPDFKYGDHVVLLYGSMIKTNSDLESSILQEQILNTAKSNPIENRYWQDLAKEYRYLKVHRYFINPEDGKVNVLIKGDQLK